MIFGGLSHAWWLFSIGALILGGFLFIEWRKERWRNTHFSPEQRQSLFGREFAWNRFVRLLFLSLAVLFFSIALLDPRWGMVNRTERMEGVDVVLVADLSTSMLCEDIGESRLERLRRIVLDLMGRSSGHRLGLVFFASQAYPVVPLTFDYEVISLWLQEANPLLIENQGSDLEDGINKALDLFESAALSHRVMVVLSDGEDMEHQPLRAAARAASRGVQIITVGIGTPAGGKIPLRGTSPQGTTFFTVNGEEVVTHLRSDILKDIANKTGGIFLEGTENASERIMAFIDKLKKNPYGRISYETMMARYQYFLLPALLFWILALFWPSSRAIVMIVAGMLCLTSFETGYSSDGSLATHLYRQGNYEAAREAFQKALVKHPFSPVLRYNLGTTLSHLQEWESAAREFRKLTNSHWRDLDIRSLYNLATTLAAAGDTREAALAYQQLLAKLPSTHPLYTRTIDNLLYLQQPKQHQTTPQSSPSPQNPKNPTNQEKKPQQNPQPNQNQDTEALLNLVKQEERKNMQKLPLGPGNPQSRYPW